MAKILECIECGYERSTEDDGQMFHEVCSICYDEENCATPVGPVDLCHECFVEWNKIPPCN